MGRGWELDITFLQSWAKCENLCLYDRASDEFSRDQGTGDSRQRIPKQSTFARVRAHEEPIEGRVLLGSTVSGWLGFFVFYWGKAAFSWFG